MLSFLPLSEAESWSRCVCGADRSYESHRSYKSHVLTGLLNAERLAPGTKKSSQSSILNRHGLCFMLNKTLPGVED